MINKTHTQLKRNFILLILIVLTINIIGFFLGDDKIQIAESLFVSQISILSLLIFLPVSLKLYHYKIKKLNSEDNLNILLKEYMFWSNMRLSMIAIPLILNNILYYLSTEKTLIYCVFIALFSLFFCYPSTGKIEKELGRT